MKKILLFSGGLDSVCLKYVFSFKNEECLFVRMGTEENKQEELFIDTHYPGVQKIDMPIAAFELFNKIIPYRNYILAFIAANYGNKIYFGFTAGDSTKDKDFVFKKQVEDSLNYFSIDQNKVRIPGPFSIEMPFKQLTKTEIVADFLNLGFPTKILLHKTYSCYEGGDMPCGKCRSCLRKFVALSLNNLDCKGLFFSPPVYHLDTLESDAIAKNRHSEIADIQNCIKQYFKK